MSHRFRTADKNTPAARARAAKYASPAHRYAAQRFAALIAQGHGVCCRCSKPIPPDTPRCDWHVDHDDIDVNRIVGPAHRACNLKAGARKGNAVQRARQPRRRAQSRAW